jgi:hypothetical protein
MSKESKKTGKKKAPLNETPEQKVVRMTVPRVKKIVKILRQIQVSVKGKYNPITQEQITTITTLVTNELIALQETFNARSKSKNVDDIEVNL